MAPKLTHADIQELLGAYAIDAVDAEEAEVVELHLAECPRCRAEAAQHREAAAMLSYSGAPAPERVWTRIAASLEEAPPALDLARSLPARRRGATGAMGAAAAIAAAVIAVLSIQVVRQEQRLDQLAALGDRRGLGEAAAFAAVAPDARTVQLRSDDGTRTADVVVLPNGQGYLVQTSLPLLDADETYQLWGVFGAQTISLGVLGGDPAITSFKAAGPLTALAITAERAGGVVAPTKAPIVQGFVST